MNFSNVNEWTIPEGSVIRVTDSLNRVIWQKVQPVVLKNYFYVEDASGSENTLTIKKRYNAAPTITVYYSTDQENWTSMGSTNTTGRTVTIPANGKLYLKCTTSTWCTYDGTYDCNNCITASNSFNVGGNIMSLLYGGNFEDKTTFAANTDRNFCRLFDINSTVNNHLINSSNLILPATTLTLYCYRSMFQECASMTAAPATIPATTLASYCCQDMFSTCRSLTTAPELPATTLADGCYYFMFYACSSLTTAPTTLPATTLADSCYQDMFSDCTSLTTAPVLSATTLATQCYYGMFNGCSSLTTAPALLATTLTNNCYGYMFGACTSLNEITTYANDISASGCLTNWLSNVAASGTFHNEGTAVYTVDSPSGIPQGWTEHKIVTYNVSVSAGSNGTVSVNGVSGNYSQSVPSGTVLTIEGTGNTGYDFDEWSDGNTTNPRTITVTGDLTLTAAFESAVVQEYFYVEDTSGNTNTLSIVKSSASAPDIEVYCSTDRSNWTSMGNTSTTAITATIPANSKLYLKATAERWSNGNTKYNYFNLTTGNFNVGGNIMSLLYGDTFNGQSEFPSTSGYTFNRLFYTNTNLVNANNLLLPATTMNWYSYKYMFYDCTHLLTAPTLPATTLAPYCYQTMFANCTSLTTAPALPATTLASYCYESMFVYCHALTTTPALPAETLVDRCYRQIFQNCSSINSILIYAQDISATDCLTNWLSNVSATGDFYNLGGATYTSGTSGIPSGWTEHTSL